MSNTAKLAIGGAAAVVIALLGIGFLLPGGPRIGGPGPTTSPTPTASPISLDLASDLVLDAGTYVSTPFPADPIRFTLTFPAGWRAFNDGSFLPAAEGSSDAPDGMAIGVSQIDSLYSDPCFASGAGDVEVGTTVDELVAAFAEQTAYEVSTPTDVTLAGYSGKRVDLTLPSDLDTSACPYDYFVPWPGSAYSQGPGNIWHLSIIDVDGSRVVVTTHDFEGTPAEDRAEMQAILDSLRIEP